MKQPKQHTDEAIVNAANFVLATRDTGYRSTAAAVAELIDNSLDANATVIQIFVLKTAEESQCPVSIAVLDNGIGMDPNTLRTALRFGGSSRFNGRTKLGRFGMGLPNSSLSQCRRLEVYSWQRPENPIFTYLDIDEVVEGKIRKIPMPRPCPLPQWVTPVPSTGTLVVWRKCDRIDRRRTSTISRRLKEELGRIFRHTLFLDTKIIVNNEPVYPRDPLFIHPMAELHGATEPYPCLDYSIRSLSSNDTGNIHVRFALLPVHRWYHWSAEKKRQANISRAAGISIVRSKREIAYGWFFMRNRRKQNYDDWWRCEVSFDPCLDEWFGVTHSKQGITPINQLNKILSDDLTTIANELNKRIRKEFATLNSTSVAERKAIKNDWRLPKIPRKDQQKELSDSPLSDQLSHLAGMNYKIGVVPTARDEFFSWHVENDTLFLEINEDHPFFDRIYRPVSEGTGNIGQQQLESMLLALARSEASRPQYEHRVLSEVRAAWSNALLAFLT